MKGWSSLEKDEQEICGTREGRLEKGEEGRGNEMWRAKEEKKLPN